jgi:hypothetical protein
LLLPFLVALSGGIGDHDDRGTILAGDESPALATKNESVFAASWFWDAGDEEG